MSDTVFMLVLSLGFGVGAVIMGIGAAEGNPRTWWCWLRRRHEWVPAHAHCIMPVSFAAYWHPWGEGDAAEPCGLPPYPTHRHTGYGCTRCGAYRGSGDTR